MKSPVYLSVLLLWMVVLIPHSALAQAPKESGDAVAVGKAEGLELSARFEAPEVVQFAPVILIVTLKNITTETRDYGESTPEYDFVFDVKDAAGKEVQRTNFGQFVKRLNAGGFYSNPGGAVGPGQQAQYRFILSGLFDLTLVGNYTVHVEHRFPTLDYKRFIMLSSNTVTVTIKDRTPPYVRPTYSDTPK